MMFFVASPAAACSVKDSKVGHFLGQRCNFKRVRNQSVATRGQNLLRRIHNQVLHRGPRTALLLTRPCK